MRIESLVSYKYFFRFVQEESLYTKPYSLLILLLIPLFVVYYLSGWDFSFLLFVSFGYCCAGIGFYVAYKSESLSFSTARKQVFQNIILDNAKEIILLKSKVDKHITYANPAFYTFFNVDKKEDKKHWFYEYIDGADLHYFNTKKNRFRVKNISEENPIIRVKKPDGIVCWMELEIRSIENGDFILYTLKDMTALKLREQANRQLTRDLMQRKQRMLRKKTISNFENLSLTRMTVQG